jgi:predicted glycosyltransferase
MKKKYSKIMYYTHNSIGLGHAFRALAVITAMKKHRPDIDFLVVSGTSVPELFLKNGIEIIKLPSIKFHIDDNTYFLGPRYLKNCSVEEISDLRQRMIEDTFSTFRPDVLIVEHNMLGQRGEIIPLLLKKWRQIPQSESFPLVHISRGILRNPSLIEAPFNDRRQRSESIYVGDLYDFIYVMEDREVIDVNKAYFGNRRTLRKKIQYMGKITVKTREELVSKEEIARMFNGSEYEVILASLGRKRSALRIAELLVQAFYDLNLGHKYRLFFVIDPYLDPKLRRQMIQQFSNGYVYFFDFLPNLVDFINFSSLVIGRAGYNTLSEVLLTDSKAILIPEDHGHQEQETRLDKVQKANISVLHEEALSPENIRETLDCMLRLQPEPLNCCFDKYKIAKKILQDLDGYFSARSEVVPLSVKSRHEEVERVLG